MKDNSHMFQLKQKLNKNILIYAVLALVLVFFAFNPEIVLASGKSVVGGNLTNSIEGASKSVKALINFLQLIALAFAFFAVLILASMGYKKSKPNSQPIGASAWLGLFFCIVVAAGAGGFIYYVKSSFYGENSTVVSPEDQIFKDIK